MVELVINDRSIELTKKGQEIKYTKQIADVFDIAAVSSSYTNSFNIPKTQNNTDIMQRLGLVGDTSRVPYTKTPASYKKEGFDIIRNGWLNVSETSDGYKTSISDGMIDFFKAIENKTIGTDLDLTNFTHEKDLDNIIASFTNEFYTYIIADYKGKKQIKNATIPVTYSIDSDYLIPSFNVKKLLELIFTTFGYTYVSEELDSFIEGLYITYPTPPTYLENETDTIADLDKNTWVQYPSLVGLTYQVPSQKFWDAADITEGSLISGWDFVIPESRGYKVIIETQAYVRYRSPLFGFKITPMRVVVTRNNIDVLNFYTDPYDPVIKELVIYANEGDIIGIQQYVLVADTPRGYYMYTFHHLFTNMKVLKIDQGDVTPSNAFSSFKISDFFKELIYRTGLTPVPDNNTKQITFLPIQDRINTANAIDWSSKYVGRKKENYLKDNYAQRNLFKMKYNDEAFSDNDGVITVNNQNIDAEKTLVNSVFYSPIAGVSEFRDLDNQITKTPIFPMWTQEVSINDDNETVISYKELNSRFYFIRRIDETSVEGWNIKSENIPENETVFEAPFASAEDTLLGQLVDKNYSEYAKIFNDFRCHEIVLALGLEDILSLDLTVPYYFKQEAQYYILNKLTYQEGEKSIGEFIRINKL